jgi:AcrR family transcriptional regulator
MPDSQKKRSIQIIDASRAEFAQYGYAGARVARIAASAGVNKQLIFYYFGSKEGLFDAVTRDSLDRLAETVDSATGTGGERFRNVFAALFSGLSDSPDVTGSLFFGRRDEIRAEALDRLVPVLRQSIIDGQGLGYFRDDIDPDFVARQAISMLLAFFALERPLFRRADHGGDAWLREIGSLLTDWLTW